MGGIALQIFLLVNVFLIGVVTAVAARHAYAHFKPQKHQPEKPHGPRLPAEVKERLLRDAANQFKAVLDFSADELRDDLKNTSAKLNKELESLGGDIVETEMRRYQSSLEKLRQETEEAIEGAKTDITKHQEELRAKLTEHEVLMKVKLAKEVNIQKEHLLKQIDNKLADAAASFLIETLRHDIDLGAQTKFLTQTLEEHKEEFKREVDDGIPIAK